MSYELQQPETDQYRKLIAIAVTIVSETTQPPIVGFDECQHCLTLGINDTTAICVACRKRLDVKNPAGICVTAPKIYDPMIPIEVSSSQPQEPNTREELRSMILAEQLGKTEEKLKQAEAEAIEWKHRAVGGACKILSKGDECECSLCLRDREIESLRKQLAEANAKIAAFFLPINITAALPIDDAMFEMPDPRNRVVTIMEDGLCDCNCGGVCPLGKRGSEYRCTEQELRDAGVTTVRVKRQESKE